MYALKEWTPDLDLTYFYQECSRRGFLNNSSQKNMIDCFNNEKKKKIWILYQNNKPVGSVAAHSFDEIMGPNSFRILTRVCTFAEARPRKGLITIKKLIAEHQNLTDQFLLPACIKWAGKTNLYATSNSNFEASQRFVNKYYFPTLAELGIATKIKNFFYRGSDQTLWKIDALKFEENLAKYPRCELENI